MSGRRARVGAGTVTLSVVALVAAVSVSAPARADESTAELASSCAPASFTWGATVRGTGRVMCSPQGTRLALQTDGNIVLYGAGNRVLWAGNRGGVPGGQWLFQRDGNLVYYRPDGRPHWATMGIASNGANAKRLVVAGGTAHTRELRPTGEVPYWATWGL